MDTKLPKRGDVIEWKWSSFTVWFRLLEDAPPQPNPGATTKCKVVQASSLYREGETVPVIDIMGRPHLWKFADTFENYVRRVRRENGLSEATQEG